MRTSGRRQRSSDLLLLGLAAAACLAGAVIGLVAGPLWLDEAISVGIARRSVPELLDALRVDGAPPLYYLLLHAWTSAFGESTVAVRLLTLLLLPVALALAALLGHRLQRRSGALAGATVLAALPWTSRYASETRMYLLVVVLVLAGALALLAVRRTPSRGAVVGLGAAVGALLLTHYWSLFLLATVAAWHAPAVLRREAPALRVAAGFLLGGVLFLPWLPTFLFQAARTGAPWADPPTGLTLVRTPLSWGGGSHAERVAFALVLVPLVLLGLRCAAGRALAGVVVGTLLLAFTATVVAGGAYTGRYTAVVVPLVALAAGLGATTLPGRWPLGALAALVAVGAATALPAATEPRAAVDRIADVFRAGARPGDVLVFCPDQLGPPVRREVGPGFELVVYPTLGPAEIVDWVDYAERQDAASPVEVAGRLDARAAGRQLFVLKASGYRTFEAADGSSDSGDDCDQLVDAVTALRGEPEHLFGELGTTGQLLFRFGA